MLLLLSLGLLFELGVEFGSALQLLRKLLLLYLLALLLLDSLPSLLHLLFPHSIGFHDFSLFLALLIELSFVNLAPQRLRFLLRLVQRRLQVQLREEEAREAGLGSLLP